MKAFATFLFTLLMAVSMNAATPTRFSRTALKENAHKILVTETPEIRAALDLLMAESETFRELVYDAFQHPDECPVIPVYAARFGPDEITAITMHDSGKTGAIYLDLNQLKRKQYALSLVIAAQVKTFHSIYVEHASNPVAAYNQACDPRRTLGVAQNYTTSSRFADRVRMDFGWAPQSGFPNPNL